MDPDLRRLFDDVFERVLDSLPDAFDQYLQDVPVIVEDEPSARMLRDLGMDDPAELFGLHEGVPLTQRSVEDSGTMPPTIRIFRLALLLAAQNRRGNVSEKTLAEQIRITLIHEFAHHFGFDEDALIERGFG